MKLILSALLLLGAATSALADEIAKDHRGTWTMSGRCTDAKRIIIGADAITLMDGPKKQILRAGDESVWNGARLINASRDAHDKSETIAFSARLSENDGQTILQTQDLGEAEKTFEGSYRRCASETQTAARAKAKSQTRTAAPAWPSNVLGGLY